MVNYFLDLEEECEDEYSYEDYADWQCKARRELEDEEKHRNESVSN